MGEQRVRTHTIPSKHHKDHHDDPFERLWAEHAPEQPKSTAFMSVVSRANGCLSPCPAVQGNDH